MFIETPCSKGTPRVLLRSAIFVCFGENKKSLTFFLLLRQNRVIFFDIRTPFLRFKGGTLNLEIKTNRAKLFWFAVWFRQTLLFDILPMICRQNK